MNWRIALLGPALLCLGVGMAQARTCDPLRFGAKADGVTKDTKALQAAIDDCAAHGGGTVALTKGVYAPPPILLKTNITLYVAEGAPLLGSRDRGDYPQATVFRAPGRQA